jgi:hypothetical protein
MSTACIDLKQTSSLSLEGALCYHIFAGAPNYEDVRKGETPEPAIEDLHCAGLIELIKREIVSGK